MVGRRSFQNPRQHIEELGNGDLESGYKQHNQKRFPRFKDVVEHTMAERTKTALKEQLRGGIERDTFEKFRKSDEEV